MRAMRTHGGFQMLYSCLEGRYTVLGQDARSVGKERRELLPPCRILLSLQSSERLFSPFFLL